MAGAGEFMGEQLVLDLPHRPALGAGDFFVSSSNAAAVELIDTWPEWPHPVCLIEGPAGCGKSHLANVWRLKASADQVAPGALTAPYLAGLANGTCLVLEDLDRSESDEQTLFHLLNLSRERGVHILLTARAPAARWEVELPDLASRLRAVPVARIGAPDDDLLGAVLLKHFSDRQLNVEPRVVQFITRRMLRSMDAARALVAALDQAALATGRKISRQLAGEILDKYQADEQSPRD